MPWDTTLFCQDKCLSLGGIMRRRERMHEAIEIESTAECGCKEAVGCQSGSRPTLRKKRGMWREGEKRLTTVGTPCTRHRVSGKYTGDDPVQCERALQCHRDTRRIADAPCAKMTFNPSTPVRNDSCCMFELYEIHAQETA